MIERRFIMDQAGLRDLLLTLAAQASSEYERVLRERNSKFEEITLISHKMEQLKAENEDSFFSPRNKLSAYDEKITLDQDYKREKLELSRLDGLLDTMLNRKEELLEGVELLDSIIEERDELSDKVKKYELESVGVKTSNDSSNEDSTEKDSSAGSSRESSMEDFLSIYNNEKKEESNSDTESTEPDEDVFIPDVNLVLETLSQIAYQCGEIANYTIQDPYRARNELRGISVKYGK